MWFSGKLVTEYSPCVEHILTILFILFNHNKHTVHDDTLRVAAAGVVQDGGGGGVARDDEHFDPGVDELVHDAQGEPAHLLDGAGPVGAVGGVADVEDLLAGELVEDRPRHRQAADAGVEHPDGRVIHVVETRRGPDRAAARGAVIPATR